MTIKHIYWFAYFSPEEPSVRYRGLYALQQLQKQHNVSYTIIYPGYSPAAILKFIRCFLLVLLNRKRDSLIVYEKLHTSRIYVTALKILLWLRPENTLYDIDDADYLKFKPDNIFHFMKNCTQCSAGSNALMSFTKQYNSNTFLLTSPVINHQYRKTNRNKHFTIGWIGYYNAHRQSLAELFFPALQDIAFPVKVVLMGVKHAAHFEEIKAILSTCKNVTVEIPQNIDWLDEDAIYKAISSFDIGVAPLLNTELNKAKSAFKMKQYLSCGVPVLGSIVGENSYLLEHGVNGFACNSAADYLHYLSYIYNISDSEYYSLCNTAARSSAVFSMDNYCDTLLRNTAKDLAVKPVERPLMPQQLS